MENLENLLYWRGIAKKFYNYRGELLEVSLENRRRLLDAMGVNSDSAEQVRAQAFELDVAPWQRWLAPMLMSEEGESPCFQINVSPEELEVEFSYKVNLESGGTHEGHFVPAKCAEVGDYVYQGVRYSRRSVDLKLLPIGYHNLEVMAETMGAPVTRSCMLVVVPVQAYTPAWVGEAKRPWGVIVQLYTLRSQRNWGIGDFTDLKLLIKETAAAGADMIGLNPLHALRTPVNAHCSPYSPSDRRFLNPLYIDPEIEPDFREHANNLPLNLASLRDSDKVAYGPVARVKNAVFHGMYAVFVNDHLEACTARAKFFLEFVKAGGSKLQDYCLFEVLAANGDNNIHKLTAAEKAETLVMYREGIQFQAYLQWLASEQLKQCQALAKSLGMYVGLMRDLAVGADGGGAEVLTNDGLFCREAAIGAPPDPLAEKGQNWGLPPMDPATLRRTNFEHFITLLRTNMTHCGALRMDHAMGLMRLWWCPPGQTADYGAYVQYPFFEMLGLLKLESVRNRCMVVGEDMGVVPPDFREALNRSNIFTNKLFYFEKNQYGEFTPPEAYQKHALAMLNNHDVPTLASWWLGSDIQLRATLNQLEAGGDYESLMLQREHEKKRLLEWLAKLSLVQPEQFETLLHSALSHQLAAAILHGVSQCESQLFVLQLEDLELLESPVNVPGTSTEYPNWQRKLTVPLEVLFKEAQVQTLLQAIQAERSLPGR